MRAHKSHVPGFSHSWSQLLTPQQLCKCFSLCPPFTHSIPSIHLSSITFGLSIGLTAVALLVERNEGLLDRSWVAGVNVAELLISQVITQFVIIIFQIVLLVSITLWAFKVHTQYRHTLSNKYGKLILMIL